MSKNQPTSEISNVPEGSIASGAYEAANNARQTMSTFAIDSMREAATNSNKINNDGKSETPSKTAPNEAGTGSDNIQQLPPSERLPKPTPDGADNNGILKTPLDRIQSSKIERVMSVTPEKAKALLEGDLSPKLSNAEREAMKSIQSALVDGDLDALAQTLKGFSPEKLKNYVDQINKQFDGHKLGTNLSIDSNGNLIVYNDKSPNAVSINPRTGESTARAVERLDGGGMLLKPGEVLNRSTEDVFRDIGKRLTGRIGFSDLRYLQSKPVQSEKSSNSPWKQPPGNLFERKMDE